MSKIISRINICVLILLTISLTGCFLWAKPSNKNQFDYLKGKSIAYVIKGFNRKADVVEDWGGYKRYTWRVCELTGHRAVGIRNNDDPYYKPEKVCCNVQFDVNWDNKIVNYNNEQLNYCPIDIGFKKSK